MVRQVVIIGAGGFAREIADVIQAINAQHFEPEFELIGFLDDGSPMIETLAPYGAKLLGPVSLALSLAPEVEYVIGIGDPHTRRSMDVILSASGRTSPVLVHPSATIAIQTSLGPGTVVCSHASITNNITIGRHVHVNLNATIGHDAQVGDYVTISPLSAISGYVSLGHEAFIGTSAVINPGISVGQRSVVGSGAVVTKDVPDGSTVAGVPARPLSD